MREILGNNQREVQLEDNEVSVTFTDYTGMDRLIILGLNEPMPYLPIMQGTVPVLAM
jgi:hypothetical protein